MTLHDGAELSVPHTARTRVVVVGSGAGGANVALKLAEMGIPVTLLEMGRALTRADFSGESLVATSMLWREFGLRATRGDATFPMPGGEALGGSTVVNAGLCFRPPQYLRREWREENGIDWANDATLDPVLDWVYKTMAIAPVPAPFMGPHNETTLAALQNMGWHAGVFERNAPTCVGCGVCYYGCPSGGKLSVDRVQVQRAMELGAQVVTRARVERVLLERGRAVGVAGHFLERSGTRTRGGFTIHADAVVLAASAIDTAILLQRSGAGGHGEGIGLNFRAHTAVNVVGWFPDRRIAIWRGVPQGSYSEQFVDDAMLIEASNVPAGAYYSLGARVGDDPAQWMQTYPQVAVCGAMVREEGSGSVRRGLGGKSDIVMRFTAGDVARLKRALLRIGEAYLRAGAAGVMPSIAGVGMLRSLAELEQAVARVSKPSHMSLYASHPMGTVPMHADPARGPLHPHFHLHTVPNLFVADSSVFPKALGVNPQVSIMALARLAAPYVAAALS